jgi:hypothetical protein
MYAELGNPLEVAMKNFSNDIVRMAGPDGVASR